MRIIVSLAANHTIKECNRKRWVRVDYGYKYVVPELDKPVAVSSPGARTLRICTDPPGPDGKQVRVPSGRAWKMSRCLFCEKLGLSSHRMEVINSSGTLKYSRRSTN